MVGSNNTETMTVSKDNDQLKLAITYNGKAVENHEIDLTEFAQSMLGLSTTIREAGKFLVGKDYDINLKLSAIEGNCVTFTITLDAGTIVGGTLLFLGTFSLQTLAENIGFIFHGGKGLIQFLIHLKKSPIIQTEQIGKEITKVTFADGSNVEILNKIFEMKDSEPLRKGIFKFVQILSKQGYENISVMQKNVSESKNVIMKDDVPALVYSSKDEVIEGELKIIGEIDRPSLKGERKNWIVVDVANNDSYTATMRDDAFMERIDRGECEFRNGNLYRVTLWGTKTTNHIGKSKSKYEITHVEQVTSNQNILF